MRWILFPLFFLCPVPATACKLALLFAVDVSGSVDPYEYEIQRKGLAAALRDPAVAEALIAARAQVALMQWTGRSRQKMTLGWSAITGIDMLEDVASEIESDPRAWRHFSTAIGEALAEARRAFAPVDTCERKVIDISGDGTSNEGISPTAVHPALRQDGITVNALVIEGEEDDLTAYFWENVILGEGAFVETANGFAEYPEKIRKKLLREITRQVALVYP